MIFNLLWGWYNIGFSGTLLFSVVAVLQVLGALGFALCLVFGVCDLRCLLTVWWVLLCGIVILGFAICLRFVVWWLLFLG